MSGTQPCLRASRVGLIAILALLLAGLLSPTGTARADPAEQGPATACGQIKSAGGTPATIRIHGKSVNCSTAKAVLQGYYSALSKGQAPGNGGGGPVQIRVGGRSWTCASGPATDPYSECTSDADRIRADFGGANPSNPDNLGDAAAALGPQAGRLPRTGSWPYEPPKGSHGKPQRSPDRRGFRDRYRNDWRWDPVKGEWDVQHPDGTHTNIGPDGEITHGKDNFPNRRSRRTPEEGNDPSKTVIIGVGGATLGGILWWGGKLASPFCGPAAPICAVGL